MILLIDAGNSRIKWALAEGNQLSSIAGASLCDADVNAVLRTDWSDMPRPEAVLVANVAGKAVAAALRDWMRSTWKLEAEFLVPRRSACGVVNAYADPQRLGADRWAALVGVRGLVSGAACVVDCGTAITIDVLAANGDHLGGLIIPGLRMMRRSLIEGTQGIPAQVDGQGEVQVSLLARDTRGGLNGGTLYAVVAVIDRVIADVSTELRPGATFVLTGGDAPQILPLLAHRYRHEPDLVLRGLAVLAQSAR